MTDTPKDGGPEFADVLAETERELMRRLKQRSSPTMTVAEIKAAALEVVTELCSERLGDRVAVEAGDGNSISVTLPTGTSVTLVVNIP